MLDSYQGGASYELFSSQGKLYQNWKYQKSLIRKVYERSVKGFLFSVEGMGKLKFPKSAFGIAN
jgi:hypothetical protein